MGDDIQRAGWDPIEEFLVHHAKKLMVYLRDN